MTEEKKAQIAIIEDKIAQIERERRDLSDKYEALGAVIDRYNSNIFRIETGKGYNDEFVYKSKHYKILSDFFIVRVGDKKANRLRAHNLKRYLQGNSDSPYCNPLSGKKRRP